MKKW